MPLVMYNYNFNLTEDNKGTTFCISVIASSLMGSYQYYALVLCNWLTTLMLLSDNL